MPTGSEAPKEARQSSPGDDSPDEQLNIQKALQIVSEHYGKRKATVLNIYVHGHGTCCPCVFREASLPC